MVVIIYSAFPVNKLYTVVETFLFKTSCQLNQLLKENKMKVFNFRIVPALLVFSTCTLSACAPTVIVAEAPTTLAVDPAATQILKRMTAYLDSLEQFSVHTQVTLEDVADSGHRIDLDVSANMIVKRPDKLLAQRKGDPLDQTFYYDGKTLTLYNPGDKVYATEPAPGTIEGMLGYARESLGLIVPAADLVYHNAYELLMQDVDFATVVGKTDINGNTCNHLLFSRPGVDFQVWVADGTEALPCKYVVTDTENPGRVSVTTVMSDWNFTSPITDAEFTFVPPAGAKPITFMRIDTPSNPIH